MDGERRADVLERFEAATELPLLLLALAMVPLLVIPLVVDLPSAVENAFVAADWLIWGAFASEFAIRFALTDNRGRFVRRNWPDVLIIVLPFLRPPRVVRSARALRLLRLARLAAILGEVTTEASRLLRRHALHYTLLIVGVVIIGAAILIDALERGAGGNIKTFGDALWWAITTVTTVGYGDRYPITAAGRGIAAFLMVSGIAVFGLLTANIAAYFVERNEEEHHAHDNENDDPVLRKLNELLERMENLERRLAPGSVGRSS